MGDRFGVGWRPELAIGILSNLDRIDVVEVLADDHFDAPCRAGRALRSLGAQVPVFLHGTGMGLASTSRVASRRLDAMARLVEHARPEAWSEHLAFVRAGGIELGHLAAGPRTAATVEATAENVERARRTVGSLPALENIATLIDPPGSDMDEATWLQAAASSSGAELLLDLHNLHANATNFGGRPEEVLERLPLERVRVVHIAGGQNVAASPGGRLRILDDHLHEVPDPVFDLLARLAARAHQPLTVVLERDGAYPPMDVLLAELDRARAAVSRGRSARTAETCA